MTDEGFVDWEKRHEGRISTLRGKILDFLQENDSVFLNDPQADEFLTYLAESQLRSSVSILDPKTIREKWENFQR